MAQMKPLVIRLPDELRAELEVYAAERRWTITAAIRNIVQDELGREATRKREKRGGGSDA